MAPAAAGPAGHAAATQALQPQHRSGASRRTITCGTPGRPCWPPSLSAAVRAASPAAPGAGRQCPRYRRRQRFACCAASCPAAAGNPRPVPQPRPAGWYDRAAGRAMPPAGARTTGCAAAMPGSNSDAMTAATARRPATFTVDVLISRAGTTAAQLPLPATLARQASATMRKLKSIRIGECRHTLPLLPVLRSARCVSAWLPTVSITTMRARRCSAGCVPARRPARTGVSLHAVGRTHDAIERQGFLAATAACTGILRARGGLMKLVAEVVGMGPERTLDGAIYLIDPVDPSSVFPEATALRQCVIHGKPFISPWPLHATGSRWSASTPGWLPTPVPTTCMPSRADAGADRA